MTDRDIIGLLDRDEVKGKIISDLAFLDLLMSITIAFFFSSKGRLHPFLDFVCDQLSFNDKLALLKKVRLKRKYKSMECLTTLRQLQQIRNLLAHSHSMFFATTKLQNAPWKHLFADYPASYEKHYQKAKRQLMRLAGTKEFSAHHEEA